MIRCFIKGHFIIRPNPEIIGCFCKYCGKVFDQNELMKEYKKFLQKENLKWLNDKNICKKCLKVKCDDQLTCKLL